MLWRAARFALGPVLYAQARRMRATAVELPEPPGPREGVVAAPPGGADAAPLRLLVTGDSSAAGVGAVDQEQALALPVARALARRCGRPVAWQLVARTGLTSAGVLQLLMHHPSVHPADVALVVVGVNDITNEIPLRHALRKREELVGWLHRHAGVRHAVFPALPEMEQFPSIPQPLAWYAGQHARSNNRMQAAWARRVRAQASVSHVPLDGVMRPDWMAVDGYHPGPSLYARVAELLADAVVTALA